MPTFELAAFGTMAGGWSSDVTGDGMADIVGFSSAGVYVSRATGNGHFGAPTFELAAFGAGAGAGGWTSDDLYPRTLGDVNADGRADIVGFGSAGVSASHVPFRAKAEDICSLRALLVVIRTGPRSVMPTTDRLHSRSGTR